MRRCETCYQSVIILGRLGHEFVSKSFRIKEVEARGVEPL